MKVLIIEEQQHGMKTDRKSNGIVLGYGHDVPRYTDIDSHGIDMQSDMKLPQAALE